MKAVSLIGAGNVAHVIGQAISKYSSVRVSHVYSRTRENAAALASTLQAEHVAHIASLPDQPALLCISDDAIESVLREIPQHIPVAHTAGAVDLGGLPKRRQLGVFYPLQSFSKDMDPECMRKIPILVEANDSPFESQLRQLATDLSESVHLVDSAQRAHIHIAAVFVNNFTTHLVHQAQTILREKDLDFKLLLPLLQETVRKLEVQGPKAAQTGPARRGDALTMTKQLQSLDGAKRDIYALLTDSIVATYHNAKDC